MALKRYSDNITARAGLLAVHNLNVFDEPVTFQEACRRAAVLAAAANAHHDEMWGDYNKKRATLLQLSIPRIDVVGDHQYRLVGGMLVWNGRVFSPGAEFRAAGEEFEAHTPDLIEAATPVPAEMVEMQYDTYNATALSEIDDAVLAELGIDIDKSVWDDANVCDDPDLAIETVKYMSVYAKTLTPDVPGRAIAYVREDGHAAYAAKPEGADFDCHYFTRLLDYDAMYDEYLVEFVDKGQPFAYVAVELMGRPAKGAVEAGVTPPELDTIGGGPDGGAQDHADVFGAMFDASQVDEWRRHDPADVVDVLRRIGAGEA